MESMPVTIQENVMIVICEPTCFENSMMKGVPKIAMGFLQQTNWLLHTLLT
jgi:hypothetical protein